MNRNDWAAPPIMETLRRALEEDIGPGDVTTKACVPETRTARGRFLAREPLVFTGARTRCSNASAWRSISCNG